MRIYVECKMAWVMKDEDALAHTVLTQMRKGLVASGVLFALALRVKGREADIVGDLWWGKKESIKMVNDMNFFFHFAFLIDVCVSPSLFFLRLIEKSFEGW